MGPGGSDSRLAKNLGTALRKWLLRPACEVALLEAEALQHFLDERDMLWLAAVRAARNRELFVPPPEGIESAAGDERHYLEGLGARAPEGYRARVPCRAEELVALRHHRGVHAVVGLHRVSAGKDDIELMASHYILKIP